MVPHMSGTTLDAQARYANGVKKILENYFTDSPQNPPDIIIGKSKLFGYHFADHSVILNTRIFHPLQPVTRPKPVSDIAQYCARRHR